MRQLLVRVPDDVHARLAARAARSGRSMNELAVELLEHDLADERTDARARMHARARALGVLAEPFPPGAAVSAQDRMRALGSTHGLGPILDDLITEGL